jgi:hypothetical protein
MENLVVGSTNVVELTKLKDTKTGAFPTDAVVTVSLFDATNAPVTGAQNISMPYEVASGAIPPAYRGQIASTVALVSGARYTEKITATQGGNTRLFNVPCLAVDG